MIISKHQSQQVAEILLNINAVKLQPSNFFTWSSGKKSPIYCDNRVVLSHPNERTKIQNIFTECIHTKFESIDYIAGVATGAIAHGMMVASKLQLPFIYVRDNAKKHGRQNQIEGQLKKGSNVIVIEDLISTGKSSINAIQAIEKSGSTVNGLISIFTYGFFNVKQLNIPCISLCDYNTLIKVALDKKIIQEEEKRILANWQQTFNI
tara:strand:+ start:3221 stop:3841 length:621 start_codon:yes stop_codon:yes gene_type:complete